MYKQYKMKVKRKMIKRMDRKKIKILNMFNNPLSSQLFLDLFPLCFKNKDY